MKTERISEKFADRIVEKCLDMYTRSRSKGKVERFLDRIDRPGLDVYTLLNDRIIPEIRRRHFPGITVETHLQQVLERCRAVDRPATLLSPIWRELDHEVLFTSEEYTEFVERFEEEVGRLPNPPTREDWDDLEEELLK